MRWTGLAVLWCWALLAGCRGNFANENDRLRAEVLSLQSEHARLNQRNAELEAAAKSAAAPTTLPEDIRLNTPFVAELAIEKLSFARDTDDDGRADQLTVYLKPVDGLGRFVQLVGTIDVTAAVVPRLGQAATVGRAGFAPGQVRDAYRSSLLGTHYTFELPIQVSDDTVADSGLVRVEFHDGLTGRTLAAERSIALR